MYIAVTEPDPISARSDRPIIMLSVSLKPNDSMSLVMNRHHHES